MKIIAFVTQEDVIYRILTYLDLPAVSPVEPLEPDPPPDPPPRILSEDLCEPALAELPPESLFDGFAA